jgi:hypothetical protein
VEQSVIEEALGAHAPVVLPEAIRLVELRARVPRYQRTMLRLLAQREGTSVDAILTRELEELASAHLAISSDRLRGRTSASLPMPRARAAPSAGLICACAPPRATVVDAGLSAGGGAETAPGQPARTPALRCEGDSSG